MLWLRSYCFDCADIMPSHGERQIVRCQHEPACYGLYEQFRPAIPSGKRGLGRLRRWRTDAGLTQRTLAQRLHKPPSFVHKCEVAERRIDPLEFVSWCIACGREPSKSIVDVQREALRGAPGTN